MMAVYEVFSAFAEEIIVSYSTPEQMGEHVDARVVFDNVKGYGPLGGLVASLSSASHEVVAVAPVDSPAVSPYIYYYMMERLERSGAGAVVPRSGEYIEPLIAVYRRGKFLSACEETLGEGNKSVSGAVKRLEKVEYLDMEEFRDIDEALLSFENVNTSEDYLRLKGLWREQHGS